jgi:drug/metabolite transporter (DMT)-like permease
MINLLTFLGFFIFTCAGMVFIKLGSHPQYHTFMTIPILDFKLSAVSLIGFLLYGFSFLLYSSLLPKYDLTFLNPVTIGITAIQTLCALMMAATITPPKKSPKPRLF